jgi:hypothetical protein
MCEQQIFDTHSRAMGALCHKEDQSEVLSQSKPKKRQMQQKNSRSDIEQVSTGHFEVQFQAADNFLAM